MNQIACNTSLEGHWINKLRDYKDGHVLSRVLSEFTGDIFSFLLSSYIYIGELDTKIKSRKNIAIIHYHTSLRGPLKFMDMQNFSAYHSVPNITKYQLAKLACDVTTESVILLAYPNALERNQLDFIEKCRTLILCDEFGKVTHYDV